MDRRNRESPISATPHYAETELGALRADRARYHPHPAASQQRRDLLFVIAAAAQGKGMIASWLAPLVLGRVPRCPFGLPTTLPKARDATHAMRRTCRIYSCGAQEMGFVNPTGKGPGTHKLPRLEALRLTRDAGRHMVFRKAEGEIGNSGLDGRPAPQLVLLMTSDPL